MANDDWDVVDAWKRAWNRPASERSGSSVAIEELLGFLKGALQGPTPNSDWQPTDQWKNVPRAAPPSPRLPQGWAQYGQRSGAAAAPTTGNPLEALKQLTDLLGVTEAAQERSGLLPPRSETGWLPPRSGKSTGIDDPDVEARLVALMEQIKNAPKPPKGMATRDPATGRSYDSVPDSARFMFDLRDNPRSSNPLALRRMTGGEPVPMPQVGPEAPPINGGGLHPNFKRLEVLKPGEEWKFGGTLENVPGGVQTIGLRTTDPYDADAAAREWVEDRNRRNARAKYLHGGGPMPPETTEERRDRMASWGPAWQPRAAGGSEYSSQVPKANRAGEADFLNLVRDAQARNSKASKSQTSRDNAVKRLKGKRPTKEGER